MLAAEMKKGDAALNSKLYRSLYRIRRVEEEIARVYPTDKIKSPVHLSIGQEGEPRICPADIRQQDLAGDFIHGTLRQRREERRRRSRVTVATDASYRARAWRRPRLAVVFGR